MVERCLSFFMVLVFSVGVMVAQVVVADSVTGVPLPNASVYDRDGVVVGMSDGNGVLPKVSQGRYPVTVRYLGFDDGVVLSADVDTVFLSESVSELDEVVVESRSRCVLHILAYVREYSSLMTYTDTVFLFREKMVDFMLPSDAKVKFKGWSTPRVLTCRSYYRFTNVNGLDSVSDVSHHHFSWSDWMGLAPDVLLPSGLRCGGVVCDTLCGRYGAAEVWRRVDDGVRVDVDVLADTTGRKWVRNLAGFFRSNLDFERFRVGYRYDNVAGDFVSAMDLSGYSFVIESNGRGHEMFRFNRVDEPFFVRTEADVYILDKEYVTVKEAKKWVKRDFDLDEIGIYEPLDAPALSSSTLALIDRVNGLDRDCVRLGVQPDHRLAGVNNGRRNFRIGRRALSLLKQVTGISRYKFNRNINRNWGNFRREQVRRNQGD